MIKGQPFLLFFTGEDEEFSVFPYPVEGIKDVNEMKRFYKQMKKSTDLQEFKVHSKETYKKLQELTKEKLTNES